MKLTIKLLITSCILFFVYSLPVYADSNIPGIPSNISPFGIVKAQLAPGWFVAGGTYLDGMYYIKPDTTSPTGFSATFPQTNTSIVASNEASVFFTPDGYSVSSAPLSGGAPMSILSSDGQGMVKYSDFVTETMSVNASAYPNMFNSFSYLGSDADYDYLKGKVRYGERKVWASSGASMSLYGGYGWQPTSSCYFITTIDNTDVYVKILKTKRPLNGVSAVYTYGPSEWQEISQAEATSYSKEATTPFLPYVLVGYEYSGQQTKPCEVRHATNRYTAHAYPMAQRIVDGRLYLNGYRYAYPVTSSAANAVTISVDAALGGDVQIHEANLYTEYSYSYHDGGHLQGMASYSAYDSEDYGAIDKSVTIDGKEFIVSYHDNGTIKFSHGGTEFASFSDGYPRAGWYTVSAGVIAASNSGVLLTYGKFIPDSPGSLGGTMYHGTVVYVPVEFGASGESGPISGTKVFDSSIYRYASNTSSSVGDLNTSSIPWLNSFSGITQFHFNKTNERDLLAKWLFKIGDWDFEAR